MTWPRWLNVVLGLWLLIAPTIIGYVDARAINNDRLLGLLVVVASVVALWAPKVRYANVALGIWLVIAPFVLGYYGSRAIANDIIVGIAVTVFALIPSQSISRKVTTTPGPTGGPPPT